MRERPKKKPKKCCICGKEFKGFGNNAFPRKNGICCDSCNTRIVLPFRFAIMIGSR